MHIHFTDLNNISKSIYNNWQLLFSEKKNIPQLPLSFDKTLISVSRDKTVALVLLFLTVNNAFTTKDVSTVLYRINASLSTV